jgi:hypothetical protein
MLTRVPGDKHFLQRPQKMSAPNLGRSCAASFRRQRSGSRSRLAIASCAVRTIILVGSPLCLFAFSVNPSHVLQPALDHRGLATSLRAANAARKAFLSTSDVWSRTARAHDTFGFSQAASRKNWTPLLAKRDKKREEDEDDGWDGGDITDMLISDPQDMEISVSTQTPIWRQELVLHCFAIRVCAGFDIR